jgi:hypothetical protein
MIVVDETMSGQRLRRFSIEESLRERLSVREIIRARIWQEVQEYNARQKAANFEGLIRPTDEEQRLNGDKAGSFKPIDWERQYQTALRGFETNGFFILIGEQQASSLDEEFVMEAETEVSFVKLVPLVGG